MSGRSSDAADHVVLIGMMGSGKTTVGRLLAERTGRALVDSDDEIEARTGLTVREIWARDGEPAFRRLETEVLREALGADRPAIVAAAGGTVLSEENRRLMGESGRVVWLRAPVAVLVERATGGGHRPLLDDDPAGTLGRLLRERLPLYADAADIQVDAERPPEEIVDELVGVLW